MIHYSFCGYMIATAIVMIVCMTAYRLLFENKVRPSINRGVLLSIYAISFIVPLLAALTPETSDGSGIEIGAPEFAGLVGTVSTDGQTMTIGRREILLWASYIYFLGLFLTFLYSLFTIGYLVFIMRKSTTRIITDKEVYIHDNKKLSSFSWCNRIFIYSESLNSDQKDLQMLISHEKAHLEKSHWIDLSIAQIILIFQWFNPVAWYMRRELQRIHEYEADEAVLLSGVDEKDYQMLLIQNISGNRYSGLTDGLNNCSLKKRIIMMKKTKFKRDWVVRGIAVCGFAVLGGLIIHIPALGAIMADASKSSESREKTIVIRGVSHEVKSEGEVEYYIDGKETQREELTSVDPSGIEEIKIDKTSDNPKVELTTKKAPDLEDIDKIDFSEYKKKGLVENYPDAYGATDKIAEYEGGQSQLLKDLSETIVYPEEAMKQDIEGKVVVRFQINTNGTVSNCEVAYSQNSILDKAALKAVEDLPGKWMPAEVDGKPVASVFNMPVTFKLQK